MTTNQPIFAFIGAGNMSGAVLAGMVKSGIPAENIIATNRSEHKQTALNQKYGVTTNLSNQQAIKEADVVVLGVKPQMMLSLLTDLIADGVDFTNKLVITVAGGLLTQSYIDIIGQVRFIRCMPNTPSLVGKGVAGLFSGTNEQLYSTEIIESDKQIANAMFSAVGETLWLEQESQIDDISAVTGSGPAYFFLFMEAMKEKAVALGFSETDANKMIIQTALGSAMMTTTSDESFEQLRLNVTSPGGSTAEAIKVFEQQQIRETVSNALDAAVSRSKEMSKL